MFEIVKEQRSELMARAGTRTLLQSIWDGDALGVKKSLDGDPTLVFSAAHGAPRATVLSQDLRPVDLLEAALEAGGNPTIVQALLDAGCPVQRKHLGQLLEFALPPETLQAVVQAAPARELDRPCSVGQPGLPMAEGTVRSALADGLKMPMPAAEPRSHAGLTF